MTDLAEAASQLYGLPPEEFVPARTDLATQAKADGDKALAKAVSQLPKPTTAAWLLNQLVRDQPDQVSELISLGDALREAQEKLAGPQLRQLSQQRHEVIAGFTRKALAPARKAGRPVTADLSAQVQETLSAAIADPQAGQALLSGRLTKGLSYAGLGDVSTSGAVSTATARPKAEAAKPDRSADLERLRRIREATAEVERLEQAMSEATEGADVAQRAEQEAREEVAAATARVDELRSALAEAQEALAASENVVASASEARAEAAQRTDALAEELSAARVVLAEARGG
jgi:hypothetical protein